MVKNDESRPQAVTALAKDISETGILQNILKQTTEQLGVLKLQIEQLQNKLQQQEQMVKTTINGDNARPKPAMGLTAVQLQQMKELAAMAKRLS